MELNIFIAFLAGLVSFLSPCILPLVPGYLSYLSGVSLEEAGTSKKRDIFINSVFFVLGFSVIFAFLGVLLNTVLSSVAYDAQIWLSRIGGVVIILFGLFLLGLIKIKFLQREHRVTVKRKFKSRYLTSFVFGAAFAAGWTPCVGAALGAILTLAATQPGLAFPLLLAYALGLGLPFLVVGIFTSRAANWINRNAAKLKYVNMAFGLVLVILGVLVFTQSINALFNVGFINELLL